MTAFVKESSDANEKVQITVWSEDTTGRRKEPKFLGQAKVDLSAYVQPPPWELGTLSVDESCADPFYFYFPGHITFLASKEPEKLIKLPLEKRSARSSVSGSIELTLALPVEVRTM